MKRMKLRKPVLVAVSVAAAATAVCGVLVTTQAAFTAHTTAGSLPISAGRLDVELFTSSGGQEPILVDFSEVGPDLMWPTEGAFSVSLRNTGDLAGVVSSLETVEVADDGPGGAGPLSRVLEVAVSADPGQDWHDPALVWRQVATDLEPDGRVIASELGELPVEATRDLYLKLRFVGVDDTGAYTGTTTEFRLVATVTQAL
ncbi:hypothetical protein NI17_018960 [Thermobifida halotolerans]|uniref:Uncharacterized protein n=1 Tax=Thermobifida halotolerans TaxID=483545 RepID=A0A399FV30_9ACTN|nr:hypothetical protein [Thermobifida halotolerans]UOE18834.1 hypothetical protein NI17_018960 [Thermobifida halotolerans]